MRVGVSFALASQCEAAITPTREAAIQHKMDFLEAQDVMDLIANFAGCSGEARQQAAQMRSELATLRDADQAKTEAQANQRAEDDARIQRNGLKMTDPAQAATLSRQEREEVYHRSVKAMGLDENGPLTPRQKTCSIACTAPWFWENPASHPRDSPAIDRQLQVGSGPVRHGSITFFSQRASR